LLGLLVRNPDQPPHYILSIPFSLQPSEQNTYADIEAAYDHVVEQLGVREEDVVLYGQSVGSGPTVDIAARKDKIRGVVLHSPMLSGVRVMYPVKRTYWFDIFKVRGCSWEVPAQAVPPPRGLPIGSISAEQKPNLL
jgi:alpha-beta hydrolase superfamily lysophospholipase